MGVFLGDCKKHWKGRRENHRGKIRFF